MQSRCCEDADHIASCISCYSVVCVGFGGHHFAVACAGVRITVGPIIGRVTDTAAVVLLEVDQTCAVTCIASVITPAHPHGRPVAHSTVEFIANRPKPFLLRDLVPGKKHVVQFSGVNRADAEARMGTFTTLCGSEASLRVVVVSGDRPTALKQGQANVWEKLHADVDAGKVDVMVHVGCQVRGVLQCGVGVAQRFPIALRPGWSQLLWRLCGFVGHRPLTLRVCNSSRWVDRSLA